ncbi:MAG: CBS domain-containing protein [Pseudomonadales bacterium]|nr:CBS domain-containing protein [Pseudomonadales bacterium]
MRTVADILTDKGREAYWIDPLASVFDALQMMHDHNVGALLVMIEGYLVGIVSERDYVRKVILDHRTSKRTRVSEIMTREVIRVTTTDTVHHCIDLMREHRFRHLPVVEEGKVLGILSLRDLFLEAIERATESAPPVRQAG